MSPCLRVHLRTGPHGPVFPVRGLRYSFPQTAVVPTRSSFASGKLSAGGHFFSFEAVLWYFFFPSPRSVICLLSERRSASPSHPCLASPPGCHEARAPTAGFAFSNGAREMAVVGTHCPGCSAAAGSPLSSLLYSVLSHLPCATIHHV